MRDSEAYYNNDAGFYIGQTPAQDKPIRSIVDNIKSWGNPLGWSRHEHALRDDHEVALLQQRGRHHPERAGLGEVPARGGQHHRDNEIFWNNFNFHKGAPFKIARRGPPRWPRSGPACCCSAAGATSSRTTASTATGRSASRSIEGILLRRTRRRARPGRQRGARQRVRPRRHRPQRPRARLRRQRHRQLLRRQHRASRSRSRPTGRRCPRARSPGPTRQTAPRRARCSAWPARRRSRSGSATRMPPRPGSRRWSSTRRDAAPDASGRPRRRRRAPGRGAGGRGRPEDQVRQGGRQLLPARQAQGAQGRGGRSGSGRTTSRSTSTTSSSRRRPRA